MLKDAKCVISYSGWKSFADLQRGKISTVNKGTTTEIKNTDSEIVCIPKPKGKALEATKEELDHIRPLPKESKGM